MTMIRNPRHISGCHGVQYHVAPLGEISDILQSIIFRVKSFAFALPAHHHPTLTVHDDVEERAVLMPTFEYPDSRSLGPQSWTISR